MKGVFVNVKEWVVKRNTEDSAMIEFFSEWYQKQHRIDRFIYPMNNEELAVYRGFSSLEECYDHIFTDEFRSHCEPVWDGDSCKTVWIVPQSTLHPNYWDTDELESMMGE